MVNTNKIKARIVEKGKTIEKLAADMDITPYTLGRKIRGQSQMTLKEADQLQQLLDISDDEFCLYFF